MRECTIDEINTQKQVDNDSADDDEDSCKNTSSIGKEEDVMQGVDASEDQMTLVVKAVHLLNDDMIKKEHDTQETSSEPSKHEPEFDTTNKNALGENLSVQDEEEEEFESDDDELLEQLMEIVPSSTDEMLQEDEEVSVSSPVQDNSQSPAKLKDDESSLINAMEQDIMESEEQKTISDDRENKEKHKHLCPMCPFTAHCPSDLNRHVKAVHDQIKDVKCNLCDYETTDMSNLRKHLMRKHRDDNSTSPSGIREMEMNAAKMVKETLMKNNGKTCLKCPYTAHSLKILNRHVKAEHNNVKEDMNWKTGASGVEEGNNLEIRTKGLLKQKSHTDGKLREVKAPILDLPRSVSHQHGATNKNGRVRKPPIKNNTVVSYITYHKTSSRSHLEEQVLVVQGKVKFSCQKCDYKTTTSRDLMKHEQRIHKGTIKGKPAKRQRRTKVKILAK